MTAGNGSSAKREAYSRGDVELEEAVLACLLFRPNELATLDLHADNFFSPISRTVYQALHSLAAAGQPIDLILLGDKLETSGRLDQCGGRAYLARLATMDVVPSHLPHYAERVRAAAQRRREIFEDDAPTALVRAVDLVRRIRASSRLPKVATPFPQLDAALGGGLRVGTITGVVSGVGAGKSSLVLMLAAHQARTAPAIYLGLEIAIEQLGSRVVGQILGRSWVEVLDGHVTDEDMKSALEPLDLSFLPRSPDPMAGLLAALETVRARILPGVVVMVVVDYAQLLADLKAAGGDFRIATHEAIRRLRELVEASPDLVCILVSQSSRSGARQLRERAENAVDLIGTGAESSAIEQACSNLINLSFTPVDGATSHDVTANISKARVGTRGKVGLRFDGPTGRWEELAQPPSTPGDLRLAEQIIASVRAAAGAFLSKNQILCREGFRVEGNRKHALAMISRLAAEGAFEEVHGAFRWVVPNQYQPVSEPGVVPGSPPFRAGTRTRTTGSVSPLVPEPTRGGR